MSDTSPILSLPYIQPAQAQKHVTHNEALRVLDVLVQAVVSDRTRTEAPGTAEDGDCHIVAPGATGSWDGHENEIATFTDGAWHFTTPAPGWQVQVLAEARALVFDGTGWTVQAPDLDNLAGVGIGTQSDITNRLAVAAPATLLTHDGGGHQLKLNKATDADTASLLFQTGWSGRAEMGTAGSDGFSIKVSADSATWSTGLTIDPDTGIPAFPAGLAAAGPVTGTAVQQTATDITPGRLMRADYGYGPGNILGTVGETTGVPTGAVIERDSNANGEYVRFADGTQICTRTVQIDGLDVSISSGTLYYNAPLPFDLPATFVGDPHYTSAEFLGSDNTSLRAKTVSVQTERGGPNSWASWGGVRLFLTGSVTCAPDQTTTLKLFAIGTWF